MLDMKEHDRGEDLFPTGISGQTLPKVLFNAFHLFIYFHLPFLYFMNMYFGIHLLKTSI